MSSKRFLPLLGLLFAVSLGAQSTLASTGREYESRAQIQTAIRDAEAGGRKAEAWLLRSRLQNGDFQEGDRVVVALETSSRVDTLQVRTGRVLQLAGMGDVQLTGVLRSELTDTLRYHLSRYLKNPGVRATSLLPISVLGNVVAPGFYYTTADMTLRDLIMKAGGPREANMEKVVVRRSGEVIWREADVRTAITEGLSLDRMHMRAGDEIFIPARRRWLDLPTAISVMSAAGTLALIFLRN
ncbi:MAG TPA: SLBB domain-containing protein [Gemmatimonadaceae bacterium]|nr:SLBB domain-containing protein [Gemmatimonadaceae bacterium]